MRSVAGKRWPGGYSFMPFQVGTTTKEFRYSNREVALRSDRIAASNLAAAWSMQGLDEGLIGGALQGRRQFHPKGASLASRRKMWEYAREIGGLEDVKSRAICDQLGEKTYKEIKDGRLLVARKKVKEAVYGEALKGWARNTGDDNFSL